MPYIKALATQEYVKQLKSQDRIIFLDYIEHKPLSKLERFELQESKYRQHLYGRSGFERATKTKTLERQSKIPKPILKLKNSMTSNSGLPENVWTEEMDAFICYEYALDEYNVEEITTALLHEFPILSHCKIHWMAVDKRILILDHRPNDYFKDGLRKKLEKLEARGIRIPDQVFPKEKVEVTDSKTGGKASTLARKTKGNGKGKNSKSPWARIANLFATRKAKNTTVSVSNDNAGKGKGKEIGHGVGNGSASTASKEQDSSGATVSVPDSVRSQFPRLVDSSDTTMGKDYGNGAYELSGRVGAAVHGKENTKPMHDKDF